MIQFLLLQLFLEVFPEVSDDPFHFLDCGGHLGRLGTESGPMLDREVLDGLGGESFVFLGGLRDARQLRLDALELGL